VLTGIPGARRQIVLLNAAAALVAAGLAVDLKQGVALGAEAIDSGQAAATLEKLRRFGAGRRRNRRAESALCRAANWAGGPEPLQVSRGIILCKLRRGRAG